MRAEMFSVISVQFLFLTSMIKNIEAWIRIARHSRVALFSSRRGVRTVNSSWFYDSIYRISYSTHVGYVKYVHEILCKSLKFFKLVSEYKYKDVQKPTMSRRQLIRLLIVFLIIIIVF